jgi:hypothetical protein
MTDDENRCLAIKKGKNATQCLKTKKLNSDYCTIHAKIYENDAVKEQRKQVEQDLISCRKLGLFRYTEYDRLNSVSSNISNYASLLKHFEDTVEHCKLNIDKIIITQRVVRKFLDNLIIKLHGPAWKETALCNNKTDFYSLDDLSDIPDNLFFSFLDENDGFIYGFHIESFINYIDQNTDDDDQLINPYNRNLISDQTIHNANQLWQHLIDRNQDSHEVNLEEDEDADEEIRCRSKTVRYMQKLDLLGYQTNVDWILESDVDDLRRIYMIMLHYWIFRAGLDEEARRNIVPFNDPFSEEAIIAIRLSDDKYYIMEELLDVIDMIVSSAYEEDNRRIGCMLVLLALSEVIPQVSEVNPWLN